MLAERLLPASGDGRTGCVFPGLEPGTHRRHSLHALERAWPETNCYVDLLIEVLAAKGYDPRAALGFTVAQDFEGDHFTFFKFPAADLLRLYGVEVLEVAIFDDVELHLATQVARGRLPLVEVDAFHLPDTRGVSYGATHGKTTIGVNRIDPAGARLDYFHNAGLFRLEGADYEGLLRPYRAGALPLFPYAEILKFDRGPLARDPLGTARDLLTIHLGRRPLENPFRAWARVMPLDAAALAVRPEAWFHIYAFNVLRQAGANFGCLAAHLEWMSEAGETDLTGPRASAEAIAVEARTLQFQLARAAARKRIADVSGAVEVLAGHYEALINALVLRFGEVAPAAAA